MEPQQDANAVSVLANRITIATKVVAGDYSWGDTHIAIEKNGMFQSTKMKVNDDKNGTTSSGRINAEKLAGLSKVLSDHSLKDLPRKIGKIVHGQALVYRVEISLGDKKKNKPLVAYVIENGEIVDANAKDATAVNKVWAAVRETIASAKVSSIKKVKSLPKG
jgi:hypothetical protein